MLNNINIFSNNHYIMSSLSQQIKNKQWYKQREQEQLERDCKYELDYSTTYQDLFEEIEKEKVEYKIG